MSSFSEQIATAIAAHGMWKARLRQAIDTGSSEFTVDVVKQDNQCVFGKRLYGEGKTAFPSTAEHENVRRMHGEFQLEAAKVLQLAITGKRAEAGTAMGLGGQFSRVSSGLVAELTRLQKAAV